MSTDTQHYIKVVISKGGNPAKSGEYDTNIQLLVFDSKTNKWYSGTHIEYPIYYYLSVVVNAMPSKTQICPDCFGAGKRILGSRGGKDDFYDCGLCCGTGNISENDPMVIAIKNGQEIENFAKWCMNLTMHERLKHKVNEHGEYQGISTPYTMKELFKKYKQQQFVTTTKTRKT